ncbi:MAG: hypothetical protein K2L38_05050, partial [Dysosmobacter sp.]|nr:hypothetical protein [Dysosmobacter sp.]
IKGMGLGCHAIAEFLERVWAEERSFLQSDYREKKRQLIFQSQFPGYDVQVFCADGSAARGSKLLGNVRDTYLT